MIIITHAMIGKILFQFLVCIVLAFWLTLLCVSGDYKSNPVYYWAAWASGTLVTGYWMFGPSLFQVVG